MGTDLRELFDNDALRLVSNLAAEFDHKVYLVGGGIRDYFLGRDIRDLDFVFDADGVEFPRIFAQRVRGTFFWMDEVRMQSRVVKKGWTGTDTFDFAPLRGMTIEEDLSLRDFTINAMAVPLRRANHVIIDPLRGMDDLGQKVIRVCSPSSFTDDPLRLLRAFRFAATLRYEIEQDTWDQIAGNASLLESVAAERIRDEFFIILDAPGIGTSLLQLLDAGLLAEILPKGITEEEARGVIVQGRARAVEIERIAGRLAHYFPHEWEQVAMYLAGEAEAGVTRLSLIKLAAILGDTVEGSLAGAVAEKLRLGRTAGRLLAQLAQFARDGERVFARLGQSPTLRAKYRFFRDSEPSGPELLISALAEKNVPLQVCGELMAYYFHEYGAEQNEHLLSGEEIMAILGIPQGEEVGRAIERLREAESAGLVNNKAEARAFLEKNLLTNGGTIR